MSDTKLTILVIVLSFVIGMYTALLVETYRQVKKIEKRQCVVKMTRENFTHVYIGDYM